MKSIIKTSLFFTVLLSGIIYLAGCSKTSSSSLVGTWTLVSERDHYFTNGASVKDTTVSTPTGATVTFTSGGQVTSVAFGNGNYVLNGNQLSLSGAGVASTSAYTISNLTSNTFSATFNDTTSYTNPLTYNQITYSFTK